MDNPWASTSTWSSSETYTASASPWKSAQNPAENDQEADIALPSWSTGAAIKWSEPSDTPSLWNSSTSTSGSNPGWEPEASPYNNLFSGVPATTTEPELSLPTVTVDVSAPEEGDTNTPQVADTRPLSPGLDQLSATASLDPPSPRASPPASPDPFGTFESAQLETDDPWTPSQATFPSEAEGDAWGSTWANAKADSVKKEEETLDEWEAAKQQKQKQDQVVPPELLSSILEQFEELSSELYYSSAMDEDFSQRLERIEDDEAITVLSERLKLPSSRATLPEFKTTFTYKSMSEGIKFTRNLPLAHRSPLAYYMAAKGSTAWEVSVKSRTDVSPDDALPVGWKIVEKEKGESTPEMKKPAGGLLSFFGRRSNADSKDESSPVSPSRSTFSMTSPRASTEVTTSSPTPPRTSQDIKPPRSAPSPSLGSANSVLSSTASNSLTYAQSPDIFPEPPSAVSRFFNKFSRGRSSPRNSSALSSNDLEFLSDVVPSAGDPADDYDNPPQLQALSNMINSAPATSKLPAPLPPPPKLSAPQSASSSRPVTRQNTGAWSSDMRAVSPSPGPIQQASNFSGPTSLAMPSFSAPLPAVPASRPVSSVNDSSWDDFEAFVSPQATGSSTLSQQSVASPTSSRFAIPSPMSTSTASGPRKVPRVIMSRNSNASNSSSTIPTLSGPFGFPPPPSSSSSSRSQTPQLVNPTPSSSQRRASQSPAAPAIPPVATKQPPSLSLFDDDDDDLHDFHPQPATSSRGPAKASSYDASFSSTSSDQDLFASTSSKKGTNTSFDDFDDFVSSSIRTPSPPHPPAKTSIPPPQPIPLPSPIGTPPRVRSPASSAQLPQHRRQGSRVAEYQHQRTMSLLETAAARPGRWPAPPSPLPEALPPPNAPSNTGTFDLLGGSEPAGTMQAQQNRAFQSLMTSSFPSPPALNPSLAPSRGSLPQSNGLMQQAPAFDFSRPLNTTSSNAANTPTGTGGLSAQDLSFFEGL